MRELVVIDKLNLGGVTSSLLNYLDYSSRFHHIDLLVFSNIVDRSLLPGNVNVLKASPLLSVFGFSQNEIKEKSVLLAFLRGLLAVCSIAFGGHYVRRVFLRFVKSIGEYDVAISYTHDVSWKALTTGCNDYVLQKVDARYKLSFVHCDYKLFGGYDRRGVIIYKQFDKVVCVSNGCRKSFIECFPELESKTLVCENFINLDKVHAGSEPIAQFKKRTNRFVTVCRIEKQKGVFRIIDVAERLKEDGYDDFVWRIVGDGPDLALMKNRVINSGLDDVIEIVGKQIPPYRFIKGATLFILPSYHEAAPMVFGECRVLGVPVLSTRTTSADELLTKRGVGVVCENDTSSIYDSMRGIIDGTITLPSIDNDLSSGTNDQAEKDFQRLNEVIEESLS